MGRKNGKTELIAALCLVHLCGPMAEINGQVYSAAADRDQAALVFNIAAQMVRANKALSNALNIIDSTKRMVHLPSGSYYRALSSESKTKHGFNASCIIYDELAQAPNRDLYDVLTTSTGARENPLTIVISTQCSDPNHIMSELVDYGKMVNSGDVDDPTFKAFIYEVPEEDDAFLEENWYKANPALGDFRSLDEMRRYAEKAKRLPSMEATFRNLYLNQRVDSEQRFLSSIDWKECSDQLADLTGRRCWAGLDLSSTTDLTALVLVFEPVNDVWDILPFFWLPDFGLKDKQDKDKVPYLQWKEKGYLETTPGRAVDKSFVITRLAELSQVYDIQSVSYDRWRIEDFKILMSNLGVSMELVPFGQGYKDMSPAVESLETLIIDRKLRHANNPILNWNAANSVAIQDPAGSRKLTKEKSTGRIDGMIALLMGIGGANKHTKDKTSIYETRGVRTL